MALLRQIGSTRADEAAALLNAAGMGTITPSPAQFGDNGPLPDAPPAVDPPPASVPGLDLWPLLWAGGGITLGTLVAHMGGGGRTMAGTIGKVKGGVVLGLAVAAGAGYWFLYRPWAQGNDQVAAAKQVILNFGYTNASNHDFAVNAMPNMTNADLVGFAAVLQYIQQAPIGWNGVLPGNLDTAFTSIKAKYSIPGL